MTRRHDPSSLRGYDVASIAEARALGASIATTPVVNPRHGKLHSRVRDFCRSISPGRPVYLPLTDIGAPPGRCHDVVRAAVEQRGGSPEYGWYIWSDPPDRAPVLLEAEFHCVWRHSTGLLVDLSPRLGEEELILFLPDYLRRYDDDTDMTYCNRRWWCREKRQEFIAMDGSLTNSETCGARHWLTKVAA